ncbi:type II toxin-antitoxin system PemK/MazF family toxin [Zafaria sp. Z1313]|uniref:type II toxin-antitoxin system PemK/MazF family toxin n=1 Tax=Zafaria sp. Z1313 TaxID=3423202 RepID=UPI003D301875
MQINGRTVMRWIDTAARLLAGSRRSGTDTTTEPRSRGGVGTVPGSPGRNTVPPRPSPARGAGSAAPRGRGGSKSAGSGEAGWAAGGYPGDFTGRFVPAYDPHPDGRPDPGEVVWAWIPYEEDPAQGKDRPVLLVGRDGGYLLAVMLTSRDRNNARSRDEDYVDIGAGAWDAQGRPSEVKLDRIVRLLPEGIRREGAVLDRDRFEAVARRLRS